MAVRSRRLAGPSQVVAGGATLSYTVPSGRTAVVRSVVLSSNAMASGEVKAYIGAIGTPQLVWVVQVPARSTVVHPGYIVLNPGDVFTIAVVTGQQNVTAAIFGALLDGIPT